MYTRSFMHGSKIRDRSAIPPAFDSQFRTASFLFQQEQIHVCIYYFVIFYIFYTFDIFDIFVQAFRFLWIHLCLIRVCIYGRIIFYIKPHTAGKTIKERARGMQWELFSWAGLVQASAA